MFNVLNFNVKTDVFLHRIVAVGLLQVFAILRYSLLLGVGVSMYDMSGIDNLSINEDGRRIGIIYGILLLGRGLRIMEEVCIEYEGRVVSVVLYFSGASWLEREVWDLYGIVFDYHDNLSRILTDYGFVGHPFLKDFPLSGFFEVRYDDMLKLVIYEGVALMQEFRFFRFIGPWS